MFPVSARCRWRAGDLLGALVPIRAPAPVTLHSSQKLHRRSEEQEACLLPHSGMSTIRRRSRRSACVAGRPAELFVRDKPLDLLTPASCSRRCRKLLTPSQIECYELPRTTSDRQVRSRAGLTHRSASPRQVVAQRQRQQDPQPEHAADDHRPGEAGAVLHVHEEQHDEHRLEAPRWRARRRCSAARDRRRRPATVR